MKSYVQTYTKHATRLAVSWKCLCTHLLSSTRNLSDNIPEGTVKYKRSARMGTCADRQQILCLNGSIGWTESQYDCEQYKCGIQGTDTQEGVLVLRLHGERRRPGDSKRCETCLDT